MALTEAQKARGRRHYASHREAKIAAVTARLKKRAEDPILAEQDRKGQQARGRRYRLRHPEKVLQMTAQWHAANPEKINARRRARYAENPEKILASGRKRRAVKAMAPVNDLTLAEWQAIKEHFGHRCAYCGKKFQRLTQDHITPLSEGGSHTLSNVVPSYKSCNSKKGTGPVLKPVQPILII